MKRNPNKHLRKAYMDAWAYATGIPAFDRVIPRDSAAVPSKYILVTGETKNRTATSKCGFEWEYSITAEVVNVKEPGRSDTATLDDLEEVLINTAFSMLNPNGWIIKDTVLDQSYDLSIDAGTQTIWRRVLTFRVWVNQTGG